MTKNKALRRGAGAPHNPTGSCEGFSAAGKVRPFKTLETKRFPQLRTRHFCADSEIVPLWAAAP
jgi:hypothetical protein